MKKYIVIIFTLLMLNVCLYSQPLPPPIYHDFNPGSDGSIVLLHNGGHPYYCANSISIPSTYPTIQSISYSPLSIYNIVGGNSTVVNLPEPNTGPASLYTFAKSKFLDGWSDDLIADDIINDFVLISSSNSTSGTVAIVDRTTGDVLASKEVSAFSEDLQFVPPFVQALFGYEPPNAEMFNSNKFSQESPVNRNVGIFNINNFPTIINYDENTNQINLIPLTGKPIGYDYTPLIRTEIIEEPPSDNLVNSNNSTNANTGYVFYKADDGVNGQELWITDGTIAGTHMVKDINPSGNSYPFGFNAMDNKLYFIAATPDENNALWVSDGTELGTIMVKDIKPGGGYGYIGNLININNTLYFVADDGTHNSELWKSDGTETGTVMIKDINTSGYTNPGGLTLFKGLIYFKADDGIHGSELWVTDGTESGTHMVKNINNTGDGSAGSSPILPGLPNGDVFYFYANDGIHGKEIWVSDGTREGTKLAYDLYPGSSSSNNWSGWGLISNERLYASADNGVIGNELFVFENVPSTVPMTSLSLKVFLEGSYVSNSMSTNLTASIPLNQPFNNSEGNYYGDESISSTFASTKNIVDWVLVELRTGSSASEATTVVAQKAVLVNSDGNLVDLDGSLDIDFKWVEAGDYYVSVYHRNHLAVMSSGIVSLTN